MSSFARPGCLTGKRRVSPAHAERASRLLHEVRVQKALVAELGITEGDLHDVLSGGLFGGPKAGRLEAKIDAAIERRRNDPGNTTGVHSGAGRSGEEVARAAQNESAVTVVRPDGAQETERTER